MGRSRDCDIPIPPVVERSMRSAEHLPEIAQAYQTVSRQHAEFTLNPAGLATVKDLSSKWGTEINNVAIEPGRVYEIREGDKVKLGKIFLEYNS